MVNIYVNMSAALIYVALVSRVEQDVYPIESAVLPFLLGKAIYNLYALRHFYLKPGGCTLHSTTWLWATFSGQAFNLGTTW